MPTFSRSTLKKKSSSQLKKKKYTEKTKIKKKLKKNIVEGLILLWDLHYWEQLSLHRKICEFTRKIDFLFRLDNQTKNQCLTSVEPRSFGKEIIQKKVSLEIKSMKSTILLT